MWRRVGAYLGLVEDFEAEYVDATDDGVVDEGQARAEPSNVRRIAPSRSAEPSSARVAPSTPNVRPVPSGTVHLTNPTTFNDVEEVGERFRNGVPVIMNLDGASEPVAKRLLDFASGLIYGLEGRIERVGERVFLLTPLGVEVSSEERRRLGERGFFNQA